MGADTSEVFAKWFAGDPGDTPVRIYGPHGKRYRVSETWRYDGKRWVELVEDGYIEVPQEPAAECECPEWFDEDEGYCTQRDCDVCYCRYCTRRADGCVCP